LRPERAGWEHDGKDSRQNKKGKPGAGVHEVDPNQNQAELAEFIRLLLCFIRRRPEARFETLKHNS
jgi:hypothetical protein